jgi:carbonic anhydrase
MCTLCVGSGLSRRLFLGAGAATLAGVSLAGTVQAQPARAAETPDAALKLLVEGNERYVANKLNERDYSATRAARA